MGEHVSFAFFQWFMGGLLALLLLVVSWMANEIRQIRRDQTTDRVAQAAAKERTADRHDNDVRDVWQALTADRTERANHATMAAQFRERTAEQLGDIKAVLAALNARFPGHSSPLAPGE